MVGGGWWLESDYSVCPRPLLQFLQFFQFMSVRLHLVMPGYIRLCLFTLEGRDVELDNNLQNVCNYLSEIFCLCFKVGWINQFFSLYISRYLWLFKSQIGMIWIALDKAKRKSSADLLFLFAKIADWILQMIGFYCYVK